MTVSYVSAQCHKRVDHETRLLKSAGCQVAARTLLVQYSRDGFTLRYERALNFCV
jgi:hypothetical protein